MLRLTAAMLMTVLFAVAANSASWTKTTGPDPVTVVISATAGAGVSVAWTGKATMASGAKRF